MFVFGGYSRSQTQMLPMNLIYAYNVNDGTWSNFNTQGEVVPQGRRNFAAVLVGTDTFLIHGGADASLSQGYADGFIFDMNSKQWMNLPALNDGLGIRWGHSAVSVGTGVFFLYGYTPTGSAPNALTLYDVPSGTFLSSFAPAGDSPNTNSPDVPPDPPSGGGGGGGNPNPPTQDGGTETGSGGNSGSSNPPAPQPTGENNRSSTPVVLGSVFGGLAATAVIIVLVVVYRRRRHKQHRRGWSGATDDSEKAVMVGGFEAVPQGKGFEFVARVFNIQPKARYMQAPKRQRFDMLAEEDASEYASRPRPKSYRMGTGESGGSNGGYLTRWNSQGAGSAITSLVNASVSSFKSAFGLNNPPPGPSRELKRETLGGHTSVSLARPPSAWRRGSSYTSTSRADPFGDEYGVEEEYQRAMSMQHEMLRRAPSSGTDEYSAL
ncbi:hypothetical protein FRC17_008329, partial [Serendipita sp. 399]